jgi:hypothetical protein
MVRIDFIMWILRLRSSGSRCEARASAYTLQLHARPRHRSDCPDGRARPLVAALVARQTPVRQDRFAMLAPLRPSCCSSRPSFRRFGYLAP